MQSVRVAVLLHRAPLTPRNLSHVSCGLIRHTRHGYEDNCHKGGRAIAIIWSQSRRRVVRGEQCNLLASTGWDLPFDIDHGHTARSESHSFQRDNSSSIRPSGKGREQQPRVGVVWDAGGHVPPWSASQSTFILGVASAGTHAHGPDNLVIRSDGMRHYPGTPAPNMNLEKWQKHHIWGNMVHECLNC